MTKRLTDAEIEKIWSKCVGNYGHVSGLYKFDIARAIESAVLERSKEGQAEINRQLLETEIEGWKADQKENLRLQCEQAARIADLEAALAAALKSFSGHRIRK